jgi:hypothetical protein
MRWAMQIPPTTVGVGQQLLKMPNRPPARLTHARAVAQARKLSIIAAGQRILTLILLRPRFR